MRNDNRHGMAEEDDPLEGYVWEPEEDITLYELSRCLPAIVHGGYDYVKALPDECRRHWSYRPNPEVMPSRRDR